MKLVYIQNSHYIYGPKQENSIYFVSCAADSYYGGHGFNPVIWQYKFIEILLQSLFFTNFKLPSNTFWKGGTWNFFFFFFFFGIQCILLMSSLNPKVVKVYHA